MEAQKKQELAYHHPPGEGLYSEAVWKQVSNSVLEPYLGKVYRSYRTASRQEEVYRMMAGGRTPDEIIVEGADPDLPPPVVGSNGTLEPARIDLIFNTFNRLDFSIFSPRPAFVGVSLPYTGHWQVELNGRKEEVYRANGAAHAIRVPAGESSASFRYRSRWAWWGILLSCGTLTLVGSFTVLRLMQGSLHRSLPVVALLCLSPALVSFLWHRSLYGGENLASRYTWTEQEPVGRFNLAYYRRTGSSSIANSFYPIRFHSGRAVDGDRRIGTGFLTDLEDDPWWILDMSRPEEILEVVVHSPPESEELNLGPLRLGASSDGRRWRDLGPLEGEEGGGQLTLTLGRPHQSRYLMVKASGRSRLAIDEIEVYGPATSPSEVGRGNTLNPRGKPLRAVQ
jgi:hypothetical protein